MGDGRQPRLDADEVVSGLFVGSAPPPGAVPPDAVDVLVLLAAEYQPDPKWFPGLEVWEAPLTDDPKKGLDAATVKAAVKVGKKVAKALKAGKRVLVTCAQGLNRSAFVAAVAMLTLAKGGLRAKEAVRLLQDRRGGEVLEKGDGWREILDHHFPG